MSSAELLDGLLDALIQATPSLSGGVELHNSLQVNSDASSPPPQTLSSQPKPMLGPAPPKQKKKRVRRETREIKYLREQARKLELRLEQIQKRVPANRDSNSIVCANYKTARLSVWESIAERQLKERLHGELMQKELRAACSVQAKLVQELKKQLRLCAEDKKLSALMKRKSARLWDLLSDESSDIYAEQLTQVAKMCLQMQQQTAPPRHALQLANDLTQGVDVLKRNPTSAAGVVFEMRCGTSIPFDVHVAGNAYWRLTAHEAFHRQGSLQQDLDAKGDVASASFNLQVACEGFTATVRGKQTCRRYINNDSETIVWTGYADPIELNGTKFSGMQCRKTGWIKLQRVAGQPAGATWVEMYSEMTPLFKEGVEDQNWQIHALLDSMTKAHSKTNEIYCRMVRELLLEEDWKAAYGSDAQAL
ncbi:hypothetical protein F442_12790 [Phytophthora nicotianae P10297]|uniref:M96 mating-specific protein family n=1 Tax=Phytophthora nicotianae P10297 TaxID=1317064 RepID=W2YXC6_PHYNI|nr:hypothetical protein F442_12790 [Phytophthora nicotianae P10297]